jgi:hypothetical protein
VKERHSLKSKLETLDNKLEHTAGIDMGLEVAMSDVEKDRLELEDEKSKLSSTSGKLVSVRNLLKLDSIRVNMMHVYLCPIE